MSRRREMVAMEHLPYLRRVEYLQNSVYGCYINSGIIPTVNHGISIDVQAVSYKNDTGSLCGVCNSGLFQGNQNFTVYFGYSAKIIACIGNYTGYYTISNLDNHNRNQYELNLLNNSTLSVISGGSEIYETSITKQAPAQFPIFIFALNAGGSISGYSSASGIFKVYSTKITEGNNVVRDFIPVVALFNGAEEGCMYDRVSKQLFRNAGTGAFTWGELSAASNGGGITANA